AVGGGLTLEQDKGGAQTLRVERGEEQRCSRVRRRGAVSACPAGRREYRHARLWPRRAEQCQVHKYQNYDQAEGKQAAPVEHRRSLMPMWRHESAQQKTTAGNSHDFVIGGGFPPALRRADVKRPRRSAPSWRLWAVPAAPPR